MVTSRPGASPRRGRGERAGLDLDRVLDAACEFEPSDMTVQAVADRLGVDRKAVSHHVHGRAGLLRLVALRRFATSFHEIDHPPAADWREVCRAFVVALAVSTATLGDLVEHLAPADASLERADAVMGALLDSGFGHETALRLLVQLSRTALSWARDRAVLIEGAERSRASWVSDAIEAHGTQSLPNLAAALDERVDTYDRRQLDQEIDVLLLGAAAVLDRRRAG